MIQHPGYFILFGGQRYYPNGGVGDLLYSSHNLEDVKSVIKPVEWFDPKNPMWEVSVADKRFTVDWFEIFDTRAIAVIFSSQRHHYKYSTPEIKGESLKFPDKQTGVLA